MNIVENLCQNFIFKETSRNSEFHAAIYIFKKYEWRKREKKIERETHRHKDTQTCSIADTHTQTHRHKDIFGSCAFNDSGLGLVN